jgi:hypothetical protein
MGVEWLARYVHRPTIHIETEVEIWELILSRDRTEDFIFDFRF